MDTLTQAPAPEDVAAEWRRRAARPDLTRVMRADLSLSALTALEEHP